MLTNDDECRGLPQMTLPVGTYGQTRSVWFLIGSHTIWHVEGWSMVCPRDSLGRRSLRLGPSDPDLIFGRIRLSFAMTPGRTKGTIPTVPIIPNQRTTAHTYLCLVVAAFFDAAAAVLTVLSIILVGNAIDCS